jgi:CubicO group peptidase (beta-lactamase class C family)
MTKIQHISPKEVGFSEDRLRRVDVAMQRYIDEGKLAGIVTMFARRGKIFHVGCYGMADRERQRPMQTNTIFRMWSITKAITTVALLMLYEEGHFVLDQDIAHFLPAFKGTKVYVGMDGNQPKLVNKERAITVRQLLLHTTGMASRAKIETLPEQELAKVYEDIDKGKPKTLARLVDELARVPLIAQPNTNWLYSQSFEIAARLIEVISGKSFNTFLRERLFEPLGMIDSHHIVNKSQLERFSTFYMVGDKSGELNVLDDPEKSSHYVPDGQLPDNYLTAGGTGSVSTPDDLMRFAQMLTNRGQLDGVRILAPRTVDLMTTNHLPPHLIPYVFGDGPYYGFGHGLGVHTLMDHGLAGIPDANGAYWKDGGSGTLFWVDPQHELTCIALYQLSPFNLYPVWTQLRALVYQALEH